LKNYDFIKRFNISKQYEKDEETEKKTNRTQQEKYRTQYNTPILTSFYSQFDGSNKCTQNNSSSETGAHILRQWFQSRFSGNYGFHEHQQRVLPIASKN